ncbi:MAG: hypothetical protein DRO13_06460 [Thermoprotei archaeon]|nr:MAG: hypothetical protein DRO13_06460 [Thermoprotei archaeon]
MYPFRLSKYAEMLNDNALVFLDSTHVSRFPGKQGWKVYRQPYTDIAYREVGSARVANMVALGHVVARTNLVKPEHVEDTIGDVVPSKWVEANIRAFRIGLRLS